MRQRHKPWALPYLEEHANLVGIPSHDDSIIPLPPHFDTFGLEIGVGKGDFIISMAQKNPNMFFFGIELQPSVLVLAVQKAVECGLSNLYFLLGNANEILTRFPEGQVSNIYLNFSDPWPKKRHEKRRLTSPLFLKQYEHLLQPSGQIIFKSDNYDFYRYTMEQLMNPPWHILESQSPYAKIEEQDAMTEYEMRFRSLGKSIHRLVIIKEDQFDGIK
jgi:tRNA (guanine-N7-)-methyltransferase